VNQKLSNVVLDRNQFDVVCVDLNDAKVIRNKDGAS